MQNPTTLQRFFAGLSEHVFQTRLGVADPPLTDYIADMLYRFVRVDAVHKIRSLNGLPIKEIGGMIAEANARLGTARRDVHQHIGDFTLFWAGVYPEALRSTRDQSQIDRFNNYCIHGKRAYLIASSIESSESTTTPDLLQRLSQQFEMCAYGLREVRAAWEQHSGDNETPPLLI